jgi:hypothetical protein
MYLWYWHGVANLVVMILMALLNISNLTFGYPICTTGTPTFSLAENTTDEILLEIYYGRQKLFQNLNPLDI